MESALGARLKFLPRSIKPFDTGRHACHDGRRFYVGAGRRPERGAKVPKGKEQKIVTFTAKPDLVDRLKRQADRKGLTVPALVRMKMTEAVEELEAKD